MASSRAIETHGNFDRLLSLTYPAKRFKKTKSGVCLMRQVIERLSKGWR